MTLLASPFGDSAASVPTDARPPLECSNESLIERASDPP
jgi:hypothetical protein